MKNIPHRRYRIIISFTRLQKSIAVILLLSTSLVACKKFVEVSPPRSQLLSQAVFADSSTATAAVLGLYSLMRDQGLFDGYSNNNMGFYADELISYSNTTQSGTLSFYQNSVIASDPYVADMWNTSYNQIYTANSILEGLQQSVTLSTLAKKQLRGEALFVRSLLHFYLTNLFGPIPFIDTTSYSVNMKLGRMPSQEVYQHIIADLLEAQDIIGSSNANDERVRPNRWLVKALLARVFLYAHDWTNAAAFSTDVIDQSSLYQLENDLTKVFLKESKETVWQFAPSGDGGGTREAQISILTSSPIGYGASLSNQLLEAFEPNDLRKQNWVGMYSDGITNWYYPYKYKDMAYNAPTTEYSIIFRLAEQYLIRAEAFAQMNDPENARINLNIIRHRAGLSDVITDDRDTLLSTILHERQVELFYETSTRWYDLKRTQQANEVLTSIKTQWIQTDTILPVPQGELLVNSNLLPQNPGYQ